MRNSFPLFIIAAFFWTSSPAFSQTAVTKAYGSGEVLKYVGSFYMKSLWTDIAEVTLKVNQVTVSEKPLLHLQGTANTYKSWDTYFKVRDVYQSWVLPSSGQPLIFKRDMDEGGYTNDSKYVFKHKSKTAVCKQKHKDGSETEQIVPILANTFDVVSVLYYARSLDYENFTVNKTVSATILIDNKLETINIKYLGKETIKVAGLGSFSCYKLGVSVKNEKIIKNKLANNIWLTADANRVPVFIKAEIPVGSIQLRLSEMSGLKN